MKNHFLFTAFLFWALILTQTSQAGDITGKVLYQGDTSRPIGSVLVTLKNTENNTIKTYITKNDGSYQFTDLSSGNYVVTGATSIAASGVTYYDATLVFLYLAGFYQFTPIQILAADVNGSGNVTWGDYTLIVKHILKGTPFPVGPWKFESATFPLTNLKTVDIDPKTLGGTCSGDVGGTFVPQLYNTPALPIALDGEINVSSGELFTTRIITQNALSITGAGLIINYPSDLLTIESVEFKGADYEYDIANGQIRLVWGNPNTDAVDFGEGETLITIHGVSTSAFQPGMNASISMDGNTSLMSTSNTEITNLKFASPIIKYGNPSLRLNNYPNPFTNSTRLTIFSPEAGNATVEVYSTTGQLVKKISVGVVKAGYHEVDIDASQMSKGNYFCKLRIQSESAEFTNTIRIVKAK
ncbi:MAG: T9SS type A sorting domain-containing protein [Bacteroidales bacterium]|nr:T9SS type A sorting domain-containing protein [Bacteroidales bacterium]